MIGVYKLYSTKDFVQSFRSVLQYYNSWNALLRGCHCRGVTAGGVDVILRLRDQVAHGFLQVVDALAHLVDARDDGVAHLLEPRLHLGEQGLNLVCVWGGGVSMGAVTSDVHGVWSRGHGERATDDEIGHHSTRGV